MANTGKQKIKDRIKLSNEAVALGLPPDPWVIEYRNKNNISKAAWKAKKPKKAPHICKANSGSFKPGHTSNNKLPKEVLQEKRRVYHKAWSARNRESINLKAKNKKANNTPFRVLCNLRKRLSFLVSLTNTKKSKQTLIYLGCSLEYFRNYLEERFTEGMSFANYGDWHIDHIKPCNLFDFTKESDIEVCFHYSNLQPLWAKDNREKSNKLLIS